MDDIILKQIKSAQAAALDEYMVWAEIGEGPKANQIILHSVRLPQSIGAETVLSRIRAQADRTLADCGYSPPEITSARIEIAALPSAEEAKAELEAQLSMGSELLLADLTLWEACRLRLHLTPKPVDHGDAEMDYKGLKIRRSAAG